MKATLHNLDGTVTEVDYDKPKYEPHTVEVVKRLIQPGWCCYDLGANIGYYTYLLAQLTGPGGLVVAFEPWPPLAECLLAGQVEKMHSSIVTMCAGLADVSEHGRAVRRGVDWELLDGPGGQLVDLITLDKFVFDASAMQNIRPHFMKIDIDGYESRALRGAVRVLREHKPLIVIELAETAHEHHGQDVRDAIQVLVECGYKIFHEDTETDLLAACDGSIDRLVQLYVPRGGSINVIGRPT